MHLKLQLGWQQPGAMSAFIRRTCDILTIMMIILQQIAKYISA